MQKVEDDHEKKSRVECEREDVEKVFLFSRPEVELWLVLNKISPEIWEKKRNITVNYAFAHAFGLQESEWEEFLSENETKWRKKKKFLFVGRFDEDGKWLALGRRRGEMMKFLSPAKDSLRLCGARISSPSQDVGYSGVSHRSLQYGAAALSLLEGENS